MIDKIPFGRTGHLSTRVLFGGAAFFTTPQDEADRILSLLLKHGINHIDTAASYGEAELRIGPWMKEHRNDFFLATKTEERTYDGAMGELENSLKRLKIDYIDHWQMHVLVDEEGWQTAMGPNGALKAFIKAKDEGLVGHLGVTGHGMKAPEFHLRSLEVFPFDSVLLPWNYAMEQDRDYTRDFNKLLALCTEKQVAVQAIKSICRRPWPEGIKNRSTWYQPFEEPRDVDVAVAYLLAQPHLFLNAVGDTHLLPMVLDAASRFCSGELKFDKEKDMADLAQRSGMTNLFA